MLCFLGVQGATKFYKSWPIPLRGMVAALCQAESLVLPSPAVCSSFAARE